MKKPAELLTNSGDLSTKIAGVFAHRYDTAQKHYRERVQKALGDVTDWTQLAATTPWQAWQTWSSYAVDFAQRSVLFWDTLRERGNRYNERVRAGLPPVLSFEYETVMDGRTFARPVNYALLRIIPPMGVLVDATRRPYLIIDPRAGHGPGIGGFKDDSQVGVALRAGHPVYFVVFFPDPEPGQTMLDVCEAEAAFVRKVRELHPDSPKPAIVGNCQGGWAAMMLAAANPEDTGPIVINGSPMSYWGGAWKEGEGDNPMRYAGGLLGGTWLASLAADLGAGKFDGAWLVQNFENLNPANTFWDKYYHVFANADTEPPRFLDFERWWGGFFLMNREEIEWITSNLFVGNKLWSGATRSQRGAFFDLREIKTPIILFASMGDNITPPQQAFNWVADVYGSTDEIKARGQVIVGLLHQDIGHLGIFVSGRVAKKEHAQIVSVLETIELLPPGLYGMQIKEVKRNGGIEYEVEFEERRLEDITARLNPLKRGDERAFEAVAEISDFNQRAYELFVRPLVQATMDSSTAELLRTMHPLRVQRWALSDLNPWLWWLTPASAAVKKQRQPVGKDQSLRRAEKAYSEMISASFDFLREVRDALSEAAFFQVYGNMFNLYLADKHERQVVERQLPADPRELPFVKKALAAMTEGGYPEALARVGALLTPGDDRIPLARIELKAEMAPDYESLLPALSAEERRRIRGEQEIIAEFEPEQALNTLPALVSDPADRGRLLTFLAQIVADRRFLRMQATSEQMRILERIREVLTGKGEGASLDATARKTGTQ
jgi:poly(3-hydroxyalkanoate) synthetase